MRINAGQRHPIKLSNQPIGPTLMVGVSDVDGATSWRIDVDVRVEEGEHRLGSVITTPPAVAPPKARVVLIAFCPGAKGWTLFVERVAGPATTRADVVMSTSECCAGLPLVGVNPNVPFAEGLPIVLGRTFFEALTTDESIIASAPTPPFTYPVGQPSTLLAMSETFRAGPVLVRGSFAGFVSNNSASPLVENQCFVDVALFVDGVLTGRAFQEFFFEQQPTAFGGPGKAFSFVGEREELVTLTAGVHLIELRWGVSGSGPEVTAAIFAGTPAGATLPPHYATITAQEVQQ